MAGLNRGSAQSGIGSVGDLVGGVLGLRGGTGCVRRLDGVGGPTLLFGYLFSRLLRAFPILCLRRFIAASVPPKRQRTGPSSRFDRELLATSSGIGLNSSTAQERRRLGTNSPAGPRTKSRRKRRVRREVQVLRIPPSPSGLLTGGSPTRV
eukprot:scaffold8280_cov258-Pinguiococcus_pyrenoidosus.AAC.3